MNPDQRDWSLLKCLQKRVRLLCFLCGTGISGYQHLATVVQITTHVISVVEHVYFSRSLTGAEGRHGGFVVCAACARTALRVPPFWIWHDAILL